MSSPAADNRPSQQATIWQIVMLMLCVYVLAALFVDSALKLPAEVSRLLGTIDTIVCLVFIGDFIFNLITAKSKLGYLQWGWIDLVSSIPDIQLLRWGRFARVIRILRLLRGVRSAKELLRFLFVNRAKGTFVTVAAISFILVVFASIAILSFETGPEANIRNAADALWWSFATITTVGYGELYPTTTPGRIVAAVLMTAGVGLFGTLTAYIASFFLEQEEQEDERRDEEILAELHSVREKLDHLEQRMAQRGHDDSDDTHPSA